VPAQAQRREQAHGAFIGVGVADRFLVLGKVRVGQRPAVRADRPRRHVGAVDAPSGR